MARVLSTKVFSGLLSVRCEVCIDVVRMEQAMSTRVCAPDD